MLLPPGAEKSSLTMTLRRGWARAEDATRRSKPQRAPRCREGEFAFLLCVSLCVLWFINSSWLMISVRAKAWSSDRQRFCRTWEHRYRIAHWLIADKEGPASWDPRKWCSRSWHHGRYRYPCRAASGR